jgi:hypothetical protein
MGLPRSESAALQGYAEAGMTVTWIGEDEPPRQCFPDFNIGTPNQWNRS